MTAPNVRVDRQWGEEAELATIENILYRLADLINAKVRAGTIYGRVLLPQDEAARKRALMEGGQ